MSYEESREGPGIHTSVSILNKTLSLSMYIMLCYLLINSFSISNDGKYKYDIPLDI